MAAIQFDATQVEPAKGEVEIIPGGWYRGYISNSSIEPTKQGDGAKLVLSLIVIDGYYAKSQIGASLNIRNKSKIAQDIGLAEFSAICHAVNVLNVQDTIQVHNIPIKFKLKITPAQGKYGPRNEVVAYKHESVDIELVLEKQENFIPEPVVAPAPVSFASPAFAQQPIPGLAAPVAAAPVFTPPMAEAAPAFTLPQQQASAPVTNAPQPWAQPAPAPAQAPAPAPAPAPAQAPAAFDPSAPPAWLTQPSTQA